MAARRAQRRQVGRLEERTHVDEDVLVEPHDVRLDVPAQLEDPVLEAPRPVLEILVGRLELVVLGPHLVHLEPEPVE